MIIATIIGWAWVIGLIAAIGMIVIGCLFLWLAPINYRSKVKFVYYTSIETCYRKRCFAYNDYRIKLYFTIPDIFAVQEYQARLMLEYYADECYIRLMLWAVFWPIILPLWYAYKLVKSILAWSDNYQTPSESVVEASTDGTNKPEVRSADREEASENTSEFKRFIDTLKLLGIKHTFHYGPCSKKEWQQVINESGYNITALACNAVVVGDTQFLFCTGQAYWKVDPEEGFGPKGVFLLSKDANGTVTNRRLPAQPNQELPVYVEGLKALRATYPGQFPSHI